MPEIRPALIGLAAGVALALGNPTHVDSTTQHPADSTDHSRVNPDILQYEDFSLRRLSYLDVGSAVTSLTRPQNGLMWLTGNRLVPISVSSPRSPRILNGPSQSGENEMNPPENAMLVGNKFVYSFLFDSFGGTKLQVIDVSRRDRPRKVTEVQGWGGSAQALVGNHLYVANETGGESEPKTRLLVIDTSDPKRPQQTNRIPLSDGSARAMAVAGGRAFIAADASLRAVDISDPGREKEVGRISLGLNGPGGYINKVVMKDHYAYISRIDSDHIDMIDVMFPDKMKKMNPISLSKFAPNDGSTVKPEDYFVNGMVFDGNMAFVSCGMGIFVLNASDPLNLEFISFTRTDAYPHFMEAQDGVLYIAMTDRADWYKGGVGLYAYGPEKIYLPHAAQTQSLQEAHDTTVFDRKKNSSADAMVMPKYQTTAMAARKPQNTQHRPG